MAGSDRWYFNKEILANTPSRRCGIDADKELSYRQQAANLIQDMGQRLHVSQLCINTAIVYMHRFYTFHSFSKFHRNSISSCALFLAAKVEEQPRKLEHVIKVSHMCLHRETPPIDVKSEAYQEQAAELVFNENLMLQTLGFDIAVEHPHTSVVNCCQLVRASKDLAQTSYFMATNSLHLTTMCLQYKPTVVACVCIHLACKWSSWEVRPSDRLINIENGSITDIRQIPRSSEGKDWFFYVDKSVTLDLLEQLTSEFLAILDKCPSRLKRKIMTGNASASNVTLKPNDTKKNPSQHKEDIKSAMPSKTSSQPPEPSGTPSSPTIKKIKNEPTAQPPHKPPTAMSYAAYRERKERTQQQSSEQQPLKSNQSVKPLSQTTSRDLSVQQKDRPVADKMNAKQQQINVDKQRQMEERHKLKAKNPDYFACDNRQTTPSKPIASSHQKQNTVSEDFYDNLMNKPSNFNSIFSADGEDSLDFKNQITTDLKMEFSDNSNQSNDMLNISSFTSDFINDSSDSKKSLNNNILNNNYNSSSNTKQQTTTADTKQTSFMAIFSSPITNSLTTPSTTSSSINSKPDNTVNIPSKFSSHDYQDVLSRIKPEPPPPMLSPLKSTAEIESSLPKLEKQSFPPLSSSTQPNLKNNLNQTHDSKLNSKMAKTPPKKREHILAKNSLATLPNTQSPKEKDLNENSSNVKFEGLTNQTKELQKTFINYNNNGLHANDSNLNSESIGQIVVKQENKDKSLIGADVPSVSSHTRPQTNKSCELDVKTALEVPSDVKQTISSVHQKLNTNANNTNPSEQNSVKSMTVHNKEEKVKDKDKDKSTHDDKHHDKHHKHSHHSHKSSKHKDKHKHKHKDKDREKHKRKDKDRDRERDRDRDRHNDSKGDQSFKVSYSPNRERPDVANPNVAPIKLKISKKKLSVDEPDKDNDVPQNPLKLRIQLKDQKLTANATDAEPNDSSSGRKRKSSPKASKKDKMAKYETESGISHKSKDDKSSNKSSSKSKKSNDSNVSKKHVFDEERHSQVFNSFGHQTTNLLIGGQSIGAPQGAAPQRPSKAHK